MHYIIEKASMKDLHCMLTLQKKAFQSQAALYNDYTLPPIVETLQSLKQQFEYKIFLKAVLMDKIIGGIRGYEENNTCHVERLFVDPQYQNMGLGKALIDSLERHFAHVKRYELFTGAKSQKSIYLYEKLGYSMFKKKQLDIGYSLVYLQKQNKE